MIYLSDKERVYAIVCEENENLPDTLVEALFENNIYKILDNCGIPNYYSGYDYLKDAIILILDKSEHKMMTKNIYPKIATKYDTTSNCVDSNMRHAIEIAWASCKFNECFPLELKPTNSQFIFLVSNKLKECV